MDTHREPTADHAGEYVAPCYLLPLVVTGMALPLLLFVAVRREVPWSSFRIPLAIVVGLFALITWLQALFHVRRIRWDEEGVTITWWAGRPKSYRWDDLRGFDTEGRWWQAAYSCTMILTDAGEAIEVDPKGANYAALEAALDRHLARSE